MALSLTARATWPAGSEAVAPDFSERFIELQIIDGDSFVGADGVTIRIENIDTPSVHRPRCAPERDLATKAVARLTELLQTCPPVIESRFSLRDKYGRLNTRVTVCGEDLGTKLIGEGLASLRGVNVDWCKSDSIRIIDGDSFVDKEGDTIRVENIDTPSVHSPKCFAEKELADKTVARVNQLLQACPPVIEGNSRDSFGRRSAHVIVCGEDLGEKLISEGLAQARAAKTSWCG